MKTIVYKNYKPNGLNSPNYYIVLDSGIYIFNMLNV